MRLMNDLMTEKTTIYRARCRAPIAVVAALLMCSAAGAQQAMTVEELEKFIQKKRSELSEAVEQRNETLDKRAELQRKQAEQAERQNALEEELRKLCDEREAAEPGSLQSCLNELDVAAN